MDLCCLNVWIALGYVWEMLDSIIPHLKAPEGEEPLVQWKGHFDVTKSKYYDFAKAHRLIWI